MERKVPLGNWFARILDAIRTETGAAMEPFGLDHTAYAVLFCMAINGDGQTQAELTEYLYIDKAATSRTLDALEKHGYIERRPNSGDGRKKHIYLTDAGRELEMSVSEVYDKVYRQLIAGVPKREVIRTLNTLEKISKNATGLRRNRSV
jgi:DNA-binding MarR family transcriptional regulator